MNQYPLPVLLARARECAADMSRRDGPADYAITLLAEAIEALSRRIEAIEKAQPK